MAWAVFAGVVLGMLAILGLCALYFVLAAILIFVGAKMLIHGFYVVPIGASLGVIGTLLAFSIFLSVMKDRRHKRHAHS